MKAIVASLALLPLFSLAQTVPANQTIGYQGRLLKSDSTPVNGTVAVTFRIFDQANSGTVLWSEQQSVTTNSNGFYAVFLGSATTFPASLFNGNGSDRWLELQIQGDASPLAPRQKIASVPYSITAAVANQLANGAVSASTLNFDYWDSTAHSVATRQATLAEYLCTIRHGIWDPNSTRCNSPLAYGTTPLNRTGTDEQARSSCPAGYTPADCNTAMFLLQFWRLKPNQEAPYGETWCAGTNDGLLNNDAGKWGSPGYWHAAGTSAPMVCPTGQALVIDQHQIIPPHRVHLYCRPETQLTLWMCMSTNIP